MGEIMKYKLMPISLRDTRAFQDEYHRHNMGAKGHKFSIGLADENGNLVGCATAGRPVARKIDDNRTLEVTRVCVLPEVHNGNSMLYGACVRAGKAMGYEKIITYTLETESGCSLKASGFSIDAHVKQNPMGWNTLSRPRTTAEQEKYPMEDKVRWVHY